MRSIQIIQNSITSINGSCLRYYVGSCSSREAYTSKVIEDAIFSDAQSSGSAIDTSNVERFDDTNVGQVTSILQDGAANLIIKKDFRVGYSGI